MSTSHAFLILFLLIAGIALIIWVFVRGWSPEQLPLWAGLIWGLMALMVFVPRWLPASIRWSDGVSVVQGILGVVVVALSVKCLILLLRYGGALNPSQRWATFLGLSPLIIGVLMVLVLLWSTGYFSARK